MDTAFWNWLCACYQQEELTLAELVEAIEDERVAYRLFMECWEMDRGGTGQMVIEELKKFQMDIKKLNIKSPSATDRGHDNPRDNS